MEKEFQLTLLERLFVIWAMGLCALIVFFAGWALMFHTDPSYLIIAAVQISMIVLFILWTYIRAAINVVNKRDGTKKKLLFLLVWWGAIFATIAVVSILPNENKDAYASTRYAIGLIILAVIVVAQFLFWRNYPTMPIEPVKK